MTTWLAASASNEVTVFRIGRDGPSLIAEWIGLGTLIVERDGANPRFCAAPDADPMLIRKLQRGTMRGLLRHLQGSVTLHAAAVATRCGALALAGDSGVGKSTLALLLSNVPKGDYALMSDDCLCVDGVVALPSEAVSWVVTSESNVKSARQPARTAEQAAPLRLLVDLAYGEELELRRLRGGAAAAVLTRAMIRFVVDEPEVHRADMNRLAALTSRIAVFRLTRPRGLEHMPRIMQLIDNVIAATR